MKEDPSIEYFHMGPWPVFVGFTQSEKAFAKELNRVGMDDSPMIKNERSVATLHMFTLRGALTYIIAMRKTKGVSSEQVAGLLAHEATHVVQDIWKQLGERKPGKEAEAYLVQYIVQCCLQVVGKTGRVRSVAP